MDSPHRKPKLVFFQWDHQPNAEAAGYLLLHMQQHVKCLATHFDVVVVNRDCDYAEICDRHEPDLALFESGYRSHGSRRTKITNTTAHPRVPKLGLHNGDPWCDRRAGFLSDMEQWGIDTFFSISTQMPNYTAGLGENLFVWPNFIDPALFHDYGQAKIIPVTLTGMVYGLYPWRQRVFPLIRERYPCLVTPQHDYASRYSGGMLVGEAYARALNASLIVPTCGTQGGEVVRKHFEIPAAKACLVTEGTPALSAAGFVDGHNCVFADHRDVVERLEHLFSHPDDLQRITQAGHDLVHSRHTLQHRPQIYQWFMLNRRLQAGEKIIQLGPFGDLAKVERTSGRESVRVIATSHDRRLLKQGDLLLEQGKVEEAKHCYRQCLDYVSYLPEARFRLALCALHEGDAGHACRALAGLVETTTLTYGASDPDPVEWACFLLALTCKGDLDKAGRVRDRYPRLSHEELERTYRVLDRLTGKKPGGTESPPPAKLRKSIHGLPAVDDEEWLARLSRMLERCGQDALAARLHGESPNHAGQAAAHSITPWKTRSYAGVDRLMILFHLGHLRPNVPALPEFRYFRHLGKDAARSILKGRLRPLGRALSARLKQAAASAFGRSGQARRPARQDNAALRPAPHTDMPG